MSNNIDGAKKALEKKEYPMGVTEPSNNNVPGVHRYDKDGETPEGEYRRRKEEQARRNEAFYMPQSTAITYPPPPVPPQSPTAQLADTAFAVEARDSWNQNFFGGSMNVNNKSDYRMIVTVSISYE